MRIKLFFLFIPFLSLLNNAFSNIEDRIIAKIDNRIITNYDLVNEVNTILALTNRPANKKDFGKLQNLAFASLKKRLIKETEIEANNYNKLRDFLNNARKADLQQLILVKNES